MEALPLALVTGAGGGIGAETVRLLATRGFHVLAGVRNGADADRLAGPHVEPVLLDITKADDIAAVVRRIDDAGPESALRVLVNNAAVGLNSPLELVPLRDWRQNFEVNFFGHVALTTALTPALTAEPGARLVNVSSMAAILAGPAFGPYAIAKRALESYSDMLRRELTRSGLSVIVVQPTSVKTPGMTEGASNVARYAEAMTEGQHRRYDALIAATEKTLTRLADDGVEASTAAGVIVDAITSARPRTRYAVGRGAWVTAALPRLVGDRAMDRILDRLLRIR